MKITFLIGNGFDVGVGMNSRFKDSFPIQSFPDTFEFVGSEADAYRKIGNAIPPVMFWHIAKSGIPYLE